jgi:hypothetical protein
LIFDLKRKNMKPVDIFDLIESMLFGGFLHALKTIKAITKQITNIIITEKIIKIKSITESILILSIQIKE